MEAAASTVRCYPRAQGSDTEGSAEDPEEGRRDEEEGGITSKKVQRRIVSNEKEN